MQEMILKKKELVARKKTSCFGGFCSGIWVKLASKIVKILGNRPHAF
jgi:hypothetical protein